MKNKKRPTATSSPNSPPDQSQVQPRLSINNYSLTTEDSVAIALDAGDSVTAVSLVRTAGEYRRAPANELFDVALIYQKFGYLPAARLYLTELQTRSLEPTVDARVKLIDIKVMSQEGRHKELLEKAADVERALKATDQEKLLRPLECRKAVAYAILRLHEQSLASFAVARSIAERFRDTHELVTVDCLRAIAEHFQGIPTEGPSPVTRLDDIQKAYLTAPLNRNSWQANSFKSALQALFAEAAILVCDRDTIFDGWIRLTAAHLLNATRSSATPQAEGYAELLAMMTDQEREPVAMAMLTDRDAREKFQHKWLANTNYLKDVVGILKLFEEGIPVEGKWEQMRLLFDQISERYGRRAPATIPTLGPSTSEILRQVYDMQVQTLAAIDSSRIAIMSRIESNHHELASVLLSRLNPQELQITEALVQGVDQDRLSDEEETNLLSAIQRGTQELESKGLLRARSPQVSDDVEKLKPVWDSRDLATAGKLKLSIPLIPMILSYDTEVSISVKQSLSNIWQRYFKGKQLIL
ncbi:MAG: hypothetical protein QOE77_3575 [Blastocatellia bacterium]|jgi:hypothetical protein|nr:hypothetical protein [Blastocatellia bacterium]